MAANAQPIPTAIIRKEARTSILETSGGELARKVLPRKTRKRPIMKMILEAILRFSKLGIPYNIARSKGVSMGRIGKRVLLVAPVIVVCAALAAFFAVKPKGNEADGINSYFLAGSGEKQENIRLLFSLLDREEDGTDANFAVVREISGAFFREGEYSRLINFLAERIVRFPDDPFNTYHLLMIAYANIRNGSDAIAARYFEMIVKNYPDLEVNGESAHLLSLLWLIDFEKNPERLARYYNELLSRFPDGIKKGEILFRLASVYERTGNWDGAMQAYSEFLRQDKMTVPGFPEAESTARQKVNFNNSARNWTFESLPALTAAVRSAIENGSPYTLRGIQAGVNFFTRSWGQDNIISRNPINIAEFMRGARIRYADSFHERSGENEAFLRTWGWPMTVSVWYLYFRKVDFPADPAVHGNWEWAGIYFGEVF